MIILNEDKKKYYKILNLSSATPKLNLVLKTTKQKPFPTIRKGFLQTKILIMMLSNK